MTIPKPGPHLSPRNPPASTLPAPLPMPAFVGCTTCTAYVERRGHVLFQAIVDAAVRQGVNASDKALAYFDGVHARHLTGLEI